MKKRKMGVKGLLVIKIPSNLIPFKDKVGAKANLKVASTKSSIQLESIK